MIKTLDKEARLELLRQAPPEVRELYGNEENAASISAVAEHLGITDDDAYDTLALTIGDIILGSHRREELGALLKERLGFTDAQVMVVEIGVQGLLDQAAKITAAAPPFAAALTDGKREAPPGAAGAALPPIRTFADDVRLGRAHSYGAFQSGEAATAEADEPVYRSSQDDIIKR